MGLEDRRHFEVDHVAVRSFVHGFVVGVRDLIVLEHNVLDVAPELSNKGLPQGIFLDLLNRNFSGLRLLVGWLEEDFGWRLDWGQLGNFSNVARDDACRK